MSYIQVKKCRYCCAVLNHNDKRCIFCGLSADIKSSEVEI